MTEGENEMMEGKEGELIHDVSELAREAGFRCPVAVTAGAWGACVAVPGSFAAGDETGRIRDLLKLLRHALIPLDGGCERVEFEVDIPNDNWLGRPPVVRLCVACGPGEGGEPAIMVRLPSEREYTDGDCKPGTAKGLLSCCPLCGGEIQATLERYYSLHLGVWVESGVDGETRLYCQNDCDLSEYSGTAFLRLAKRDRTAVMSRTAAVTRAASPRSGCHPA